MRITVLGGLGAHPTVSLPHWLPNAGLRLTLGRSVMAYTGDTGPDPALTTLARDADLLIAEATYSERTPPRHAGNLSTAVEVGRCAAEAGARRLLLTHLWPDADPATAVAAACRASDGPVAVAHEGLVIDLPADESGV